jgi:hypothetical protein
MGLGRRNMLLAVQTGVGRRTAGKIAADLETGGAANLLWGGTICLLLNAVRGWRGVGVLMRPRLRHRQPIG